MRLTSTLLPLLLVLGSCSAPPKPPQADESQKRPANASGAVNLQVCQSELQSTRIAARDSHHAAEAARATIRQLASQQHLLATQALRAGQNTVYTILFPFGDAHVNLRPVDASRLGEAARSSAWIVLRGRTDGSTDSPVEARIARKRSESARAHLVEAGVDPARIRTTWQSVGDLVADNASEAGRRLNRRVEIELYPAPPRLATAAVPEL